jgi:hypothetical protein
MSELIIYLFEKPYQKYVSLVTAKEPADKEMYK